MKIGDVLTSSVAKVEFELLKNREMLEIVVLKEGKDEIIKKFDSQNESYAVIYKLIEEKFEIFELLRLSDNKNEKEEKLIRLNDVMEYIGISKAQIYKLMAANSFPRQKKCGSASLWKKSEILEYVNTIGA